MNKSNSLKDQIRRNLVALISLAIAITSLGYNTWRNEASEYNRNQRLVSIQVLVLLGEVHQFTLDRHYGKNIDGEAVLRKAWARVLTIQDIAMVAEGDVPSAANTLYETWNADYNALGENVAAKDRIVEAISGVRAATHEVLRSLD